MFTDIIDMVSFLLTLLIWYLSDYLYIHMYSSVVIFDRNCAKVYFNRKVCLRKMSYRIISFPHSTVEQYIMHHAVRALPFDKDRSVKNHIP